ncbi:CDP-diacylglycerol--serine O-phosphatidyltransferase [Thermodesulfobacteriota bacterium]
MPERNPNKKPFFRKKKKRPNGQDSFVQRQRGRIPVNRMKKGIFVFPSLLTLTSIFLGFYAIINAISGQYVLAGALIVVAGFFDKIDGTVARLTKTSTRFGLELDSLADVISFGVAPALLMYMWALEGYGRMGWVTCFVYVSCGALRLARFNVQSGTIDPERFMGLPIPGAAGMIATTVLFCHKLNIPPSDYSLVLLVLTYLLSFFMVSNVRFHAFKDLTIVRRKPFSSTVAFVLLLALIAVSPYLVPFFICAAYVASGPVITLLLYRANKRNKEEARKPPETEEADAEATP